MNIFTTTEWKVRIDQVSDRLNQKPSDFTRLAIESAVARYEEDLRMNHPEQFVQYQDSVNSNIKGEEETQTRRENEKAQREVEKARQKQGEEAISDDDDQQALEADSEPGARRSIMSRFGGGR